MGFLFKRKKIYRIFVLFLFHKNCLDRGCNDKILINVLNILYYVSYFRK